MEQKAIIKQTVHETLTALGFDVQNPLETQADMLFLNKTRKLWGSVLTKVVLLLASAITLGLIGIAGAAIIN